MADIRPKEHPSMVECEVEGCDGHVSRGDIIIRTSPKGGPFRGMCEDHIDVIRTLR